MKSKSAEIWQGLTPQQRASLLFVAEVDVAETIDAIEDTDEDKTAYDEALHRAGVSTSSDAWWTPKGKGSALVKKGLVKLEPYDAYLRTDHYALTPLGRRVIEHAKKILRAPSPPQKKKSPTQLDAEIAASLGKGVAP